MIINYNRCYSGLGIEFKSPQSQLKMKEMYQNNGFHFLISNDYDLITCRELHKYMKDMRLPCSNCHRYFLSIETKNIHLEKANKL